MWSRRIRFLVTISCIVASPVTGQGYGALDDDGPPQQFNNQRPVGGNNQFPPNQQASNLPQYESAEQAPRQNPAFPQPPQQQFSPQGQGGPAPAQQPGGSPPWWQGQNAFQRPPGHPGVEMLAPPGQQQQAPYNAPPTQPPYSAPAPPQPPATQQPYANPQSPPPVPQEPNIPQFNNPAPQPQPQQPGFGWNAPQSQQPPRQNYNPQGQGFPPVDEAPGCDLVNKADCHNRNVLPPPQNYQPPPQFQQPQPYQPQPQQQQPYQPVPLPNQGYQPPPPQPTTTRAPYTPAPTPRPYQPPQAPRPNNPYQSNQASSPNFQQPPRQQQQRPYTPPQTPQAQQQQQAQEAGLPYPGCPAAMKCVQDDYCNAIGLIEDAPIQFSAADRLHRVALMQCSEPMTGIVGVCCRDPNYTDPWPDMKKDGGHHHHPVDKGQAQGQFQPPQGNHLQSGNPYSGQILLLLPLLPAVPQPLLGLPTTTTARSPLISQSPGGYALSIRHPPTITTSRTVTPLLLTNGDGTILFDENGVLVNDVKSVYSASSSSYFFNNRNNNPNRNIFKYNQPQVPALPQTQAQQQLLQNFAAAFGENSK